MVYSVVTENKGYYFWRKATSFPFLLKEYDFSKKSTNQMHQSLRFIARRLNTAQHVSVIPHAHHQELINCSSRLWFTVGTWW